MRCAELQIQLTEAVSTLAGQKELIAKLEHDLSTIQALSAVHRPDAEVSPTHGARLPAAGRDSSECPQGLTVTGGGANTSYGGCFITSSFIFFLLFLSQLTQPWVVSCLCSGTALEWEGVLVVPSRDSPGQRMGCEG